MKWIAFRVRTKSDAEDIVISSMQDIGLYGAQIEDHVPELLPGRDRGRARSGKR